MAIQEVICYMFRIGTTCASMPLDKLMIEYLLVPSVILIVFLYLAASSFLGGFKAHPKIDGLLAITFYIIIVYSGWYGPFAGFIWGSTTLFLISAAAIFFFTLIIPKHIMDKATGFGGYLGERKYNIKKMEDAIRLKENEISRLKHDLDGLNNKLKADPNNTYLNTSVVTLTEALRQAENQKEEFKTRLDEIKKSKGMGFIGR